MLKIARIAYKRHSKYKPRGSIFVKAYITGGFFRSKKRWGRGAYFRNVTVSSFISNQHTFNTLSAGRCTHYYVSLRVYCSVIMFRLVFIALISLARTLRGNENETVVIS